jgi:AcrR family transcriptional regulator
MQPKHLLSPKAPAKTGRPMSFDKEAALASAMHLFWQRGYEGTSMAELTAAMKITAPSLYNAFGGKEQLFLAAIERYMSTIGSAAKAALDDTPQAREAIRLVLEHTAREDVRSSHPRGCMLVASANNGSAAPQAALQHVARYLHLHETAFRQRIERGQRDGDVAASVDAAGLASFYLSVVSGMATLARNGAGRDQLLAICGHAMRAWPAQ